MREDSTALEDLAFSFDHHAELDGPDLILDGVRYDGFYADHDAWVAVAVRAPIWIRDLSDENRCARRLISACAPLVIAAREMDRSYSKAQKAWDEWARRPM